MGSEMCIRDRPNKVLTDLDEKSQTVDLLFKCACRGEFGEDLLYLDTDPLCKSVSGILPDDIKISDLPVGLHTGKGFSWRKDWFCLPKPVVAQWLAKRGVPWPKLLGDLPGSAPVSKSPPPTSSTACAESERTKDDRKDGEAGATYQNSKADVFRWFADHSSRFRTGQRNQTTAMFKECSEATRAPLPTVKTYWSERKRGNQPKRPVSR